MGVFVVTFCIITVHKYSYVCDDTKSNCPGVFYVQNYTHVLIAIQLSLKTCLISEMPL